MLLRACVFCEICGQLQNKHRITGGSSFCTHFSETIRIVYGIREKETIYFGTMTTERNFLILCVELLDIQDL